MGTTLGRDKVPCLDRLGLMRQFGDGRTRTKTGEEDTAKSVNPRPIAYSSPQDSNPACLPERWVSTYFVLHVRRGYETDVNIPSVTYVRMAKIILEYLQHHAPYNSIYDGLEISGFLSFVASLFIHEVI